MKTIFLLAILAFSLPDYNQAVKPKKVVFFGDSITEMGVQSGGYIDVLRKRLVEKNKGSQYEIIGAGIGGNKIYDLYLRVEDDVLIHQPDQVFIWVGVNDVWHKKTHLTGTDPDKFVRFYTALVRKLKKAGAQVVLCTPAAIGEKTDYTNELDGDLNRYSQMIRDLARQENCGLVDLRKEFLQYNLKHNLQNAESGILTNDRVHLNEKGNAFVAEKMMEALIQP